MQIQTNLSRASTLPAAAIRSIATPPDTLKFNGIYQDLLKGKSTPPPPPPVNPQEDSISKTLSSPMAEIQGRSLNGAEMLELIHDIGRTRNRASLLPHIGYNSLITSWFLTLGISYFITAMIYESKGISEDKFHQLRREAGRTKGASPAELHQLFGDNEKLHKGLALLKTNGLIRTMDNGHDLQLTDAGHAWLRKAQKGFLKAQPAQSTQKAPAKDMSAHRIQKIQTLCLDANGMGFTGWDVLKKLSTLSAQRSTFHRLMKRDVTEKDLRLQCGGTPAPEKFEALMIELEILGLVKPNVVSDSADKRRWSLSEESKKLLKSEDGIAALAVNPAEVHQLIETQIAKLQEEKGARAEELRQVQERLTEALNNIPNLQTQRNEAELKVLALDENWKKAAESIQDQDAIQQSLHEAIFQARLLEKQAQFQEKKATQLKKQQTTFKAHHTRWLQQTNETLLRLHEVLMELKDRQAEQSAQQSIDEILAKLTRIDHHQTVQEEAQLKDLAAQVAPTSKTETAERTQSQSTDILAELALSKELNQNDIIAQIDQMRQRQQQHQNRNNSNK